ncbi:MAG: LSM domain-containing protein [Thermoplasmata archaeon]
MSGSLVSAWARASGQRVTVRLKDGRTIVGRLAGADEYLNLVLEGSEVLGPGETSRRFGRLVVRGSAITSAHAGPGGTA